MFENIPQPPKLQDQLRDKVRLQDHSLATDASVFTGQDDLFFNGKRRPEDKGLGWGAFLTHLAVEGQASAWGDWGVGSR